MPKFAEIHCWLIALQISCYSESKCIERQSHISISFCSQNYSRQTPSTSTRDGHVASVINLVAMTIVNQNVIRMFNKTVFLHAQCWNLGVYRVSVTSISAPCIYSRGANPRSERTVTNCNVDAGFTEIVPYKDVSSISSSAIVCRLASFVRRQLDISWALEPQHLGN